MTERKGVKKKAVAILVVLKQSLDHAALSCLEIPCTCPEPTDKGCNAQLWGKVLHKLTLICAPSLIS